VHPGDRFGRYQITRLIGRGAMGEVYLATDLEERRDVALKLVYKGPHPEDQEILDAERLGAELQKRLSEADPRVVAVRRYGEIGGDLFIEMEYIEGDDLSAVLSRGPVLPAFAAYVASELCGILENLRAFTTTIGDRQFVGVVHGDLKPRNIRLNLKNHVKVLDFGIAKALSNTSKYTMNLFASAAYCSPERLESQKMDAQSDLWSVGVLLYQMVAGALPFEGATREQVERRIRSSVPPPPLPESCPEPLRRIIFKMLAWDPEGRYATAAAVKEDLIRFQGNEPVMAGPVPEFDLESDATVRSAPTSGVESDKTVRTVIPGRGTSSAATLVRPRRSTSRNIAIGCLGVIGASILLAAGFGYMQYRFWQDADQLKTDIEAERVNNVGELWTRYQALEHRQHLPGLFHGARGALKKRLIAAADVVINEFRDNDAPAVYEPQWVQVRNQMAHALEIDPGDHGVLGRLRLADGHIDRIESSRLRGAARQKRLNSAIAKFMESAELMKHSPDPYLGLSRLYIYELNDTERAEEALNNASRNGHPMGRREMAQLADGYRRRADWAWKESRGAARIPEQERKYLDQAREDYRHAQELYTKAQFFGQSARNELAVIQGQQRVEQRMAELRGGLSSQ
jgi:serine/threonine protein kinase